MKATIKERLIAYLIDSLIVVSLINILCINLPINEEAGMKNLEHINNEYLIGNITDKEYKENTQEILYNYKKNNIIPEIISLIMTFAYYVVFQYTNNGQTLGKKLMKIQVVNKKTSNRVNIFKGFIRTLFIYNIFSGIIGIVTIYTLNSNLYFNIYEVTLIFENIFIIITAILINKKNVGLHDMLSGTKVIKLS